MWWCAPRLLAPSCWELVSFLRWLSRIGGCSLPDGVPDVVVLLRRRRPNTAPEIGEGALFIAGGCIGFSDPGLGVGARAPWKTAEGSASYERGRYA